MILKILQQTTNFTKTMEAVNIASSQSTGSESDLIFPLTIGAFSICLFIFGIADVINSSTSNNREVLSNPNNSKIIEEINKRRLSNENNFKNPNNSKIIEEINKRRLSNENNFKKPNSSN